LDLSFASNRFLIIFWLLSFAALMLSHETALGLLHFARARGRNLRNIVIVGELREAAALAERIEKESTFGYRVLQIIDPGDPTK
jgi:FlaA1/EpsC-like NDP-sugar epimerase